MIDDIRYVLTGDWETYINTIYGSINKVIEEGGKILTMSPESNVAIWNVILGIFNIVLPLGFTLATILILINLIGKAAMFKMNNYENIVKMFLMLTIGKLVLENSLELMSGIYEIVANLITDVGITNTTVSNVNTADLIDDLKNANKFQQMIAVFQLTPIRLLTCLMSVGVIAMTYGRLIEIYVHMALAPIPLATAVSEEYNHIAKKFIQSYAAVCLQGLVMLISFSVFSGLCSGLMNPVQNNSFLGGGIGFLVAIFILMGVMFKSGTWSKQIVGLM